MKSAFLFVAAFAFSLQTNLFAQTDLQKLATANNTFAFKLLKELASEQPDKNIFISPYSAATALQMVANGAAGQTKTEMQKALETADISETELNQANQAAQKLLNANKDVILTTANALWYRQGSKIKDSFLADNKKYFDSTIKSADFGNPSVAEAEINQWASDQTHGRINGIANGMVNPIYTDLILANAIYFKGKWLDPFDKNLTKDHSFHPSKGNVKKILMMEMSKNFIYSKAADYQAVRLPYMGYNLSMYVFLPDKDSSIKSLLGTMNRNSWRNDIEPEFKSNEGRLVWPKFRLENTFDLNDPLKALGMKTIFESGQADLSEMFSDPHHVSGVKQKAFVEVNEEGTEAAAVTLVNAVTAGMAMEPPKPFEMIVDRPFLFLIVDARSQMIYSPASSMNCDSNWILFHPTPTL